MTPRAVVSVLAIGAATGITATHAWNQFWRWYYRGIGR